MKLAGIIGTAVLSLTLGVAAPAFAQEHEQQEEHKAEPAKQEEPKAQPAKAPREEQKPAQQPEKEVRQQAKPTADRGKQEEKTTQRTEQSKPEQKAAANHGGGRIPAERFKANFGRQHTFHVSQAEYSGGRRFQYGGYSFGFVDAWPSNWLYTQDVYVVEINGVYYLCNAEYPGVNIALAITL